MIKEDFYVLNNKHNKNNLDSIIEYSHALDQFRLLYCNGIFFSFNFG